MTYKHRPPWTRRAVLERLRDSEECTVTALAAPFDMSQPAISQHLRRERRYVLNRRPLKSIAARWNGSRWCSRSGRHAIHDCGRRGIRDFRSEREMLFAAIGGAVAGAYSQRLSFRA